MRRAGDRARAGGMRWLVVAAAMVIVVAATSCGVGSGGGSRTISLPTTSPGGGSLPSSLPSVSVPTTVTTPTLTTSTSTTSVTLTPTTAPTSSSSISYWWFVAAAVAVVVLMAIFAMIRSRRRSGRGWTQQVQHVGALGATVQDFVSSSTMNLTQPLPADRALAIDQRINDLDVELRRLQAEAPDEQTGVRVSGAVLALGSLRSSVGLLVNVPPGEALTRQTGVVNARLADFDTALRGVTQPG
jgi:hypothetical protein